MQPNTTCHQICSCKVLTSRGWFNDLKNEMQRNARFSEPKIRNEVVLSMMHHIVGILEKYRTTMSEEIFKTVHFELFKLVVPMAVNSKGERPNGPHDAEFEPIPWVFSSASIEKLPTSTPCPQVPPHDHPMSPGTSPRPPHVPRYLPTATPCPQVPPHSHPVPPGTW